jgi:alginate O-acetyltransferase complex protein AlgI
MVTGFWHGADWNFILWGGYFGIVMLLEKFFFNKVLDKAPKPFRHVYVMLILFMSWAFFDALSFSEAFDVLGRMYGVGATTFIDMEALYYLRSYAVPFVIGIVGTTPLIKRIAEKLDAKKTVATILEPVVLAVILVLSTAAMVDGSFNPFIYFRF